MATVSWYGKRGYLKGHKILGLSECQTHAGVNYKHLKRLSSQDRRNGAKRWWKREKSVDIPRTEVAKQARRRSYSCGFPVSSTSASSSQAHAIPSASQGEVAGLEYHHHRSHVDEPVSYVSTQLNRSLDSSRQIERHVQKAWGWRSGLAHLDVFGYLHLGALRLI